MWTRESEKSLNRLLQSRSNLALCFFLLSAATLTIAFGGAWLLIRLRSFVPTGQKFLFPPEFVVSTLLLMVGSATLQNARLHVRCERQRIFRRRLMQSLFCWITFVMVQTQGLWCLLAQKDAARTIGLRDGAFAFALMHGVHFIVALLFVAFVFLQGLANRYDHEYSWDVTFCAWFWHALGIIWLVIVAGFVIAAFAPV